MSNGLTVVVNCSTDLTVLNLVRALLVAYDFVPPAHHLRVVLHSQDLPLNEEYHVYKIDYLKQTIPTLNDRYTHKLNTFLKKVSILFSLYSLHVIVFLVLQCSNFFFKTE